MKRQEVDWEAGRWTTQPIRRERTARGLEVVAAQGSDFWEKTLYGFQRGSGHALLAACAEHSAMEVSFELKGFDSLYDQAGLMLWSSSSQWIKAGIEVNDGVPCLGAVVTDGYSDWSLCPVPSWKERVVTIRASRTQDAVIIRATAAGEPWRTIRVARFAPRDAAEAGPFLCAPERAGFAVRFVSWFKTEADAELHWLPPAPDA